MKKISKIGILVLVLIIATTLVNATPAIPSINFDKNSYNLGDTVVITLSSDYGIDGFMVDMYYGSSGVDFVEDFDGKYISASSNSIAVISFKPTKGDTYITIEAWAFDVPESQGGIPSERTMSQIWIKDRLANTPNETTTPVGFEFISVCALVLLFVLIARNKTKRKK